MVRPDGWAYGLVLETGAALLLVWRRYWPLVVSTAAAGMLLLIPWAGPQLDQLSTPILALALICYSLGRWIANLRGLVGIGLLLLMFLVDFLFIDARSHDFTDVVFVATLAIPPYVFGRISRKLAAAVRAAGAPAGLDPRPGCARRTGPDSARAARCDRPLAQRHGRTDGGSAGPSAQFTRPGGCAAAVRRRHGPEAARGDRPAASPDSRRRRRARPAAHAGSRRRPRLGGVVPRERADGGGRHCPAGGAAARRRGRLGVPRGTGASHQRPEICRRPRMARRRFETRPVADLLREPVGSSRIVRGSGLGLQGMAERVGQLGGTLDRSRTADDRFVVDVDIPLDREQAS